MKTDCLYELLKKCPPPRSEMSHVFHVGGYALMTDAHFMLAIESGDGELPPAKLKESSMKFLAREVDGDFYDVGHLKEFADRPQPPCIFCNDTKRSVCDECKGRAKHECNCGHEHDCAVCKGVGWVPCECFHSTPAKMFGKVINLCLINKPLAYLSGYYQVSAGAAEEPVVLVGDGWRLVVMPMRVKESVAESFEPRQMPALTLAQEEKK